MKWIFDLFKRQMILKYNQNNKFLLLGGFPFTLIQLKKIELELKFKFKECINFNFENKKVKFIIKVINIEINFIKYNFII